MKLLLSLLYGLLIRCRVFLYMRGILKIRKLSHPVISIGNLTVGGTGKTPFVLYLARVLQGFGRRPAILSRGYKGNYQSPLLEVSLGKGVLCGPSECGDEPYLLAKSLSGVPVVVAKERFQAGDHLEQMASTPLIHILDDGFQHIQLHRDLNILLIDGTDPFGNGSLLPAGKLREPLSELRRADLIIITRSHQLLHDEEIQRVIRKHNPAVHVSYFYHDATGLRELGSDRELPVHHLLGRPIAALAAIGNPDAFLADLAHYQLKVVKQFLFRDHHRFSQEELDKALQTVRGGDADALITTEKDAVRLEGLKFETREILVFRIAFRTENDSEFRNSIQQELQDLESNLSATGS
jgi:tetraacyldisaccharide 4'-kinase